MRLCEYAEEDKEWEEAGADNYENEWKTPNSFMRDKMPLKTLLGRLDGTYLKLDIVNTLDVVPLTTHA